ncbi:hypothetical protein [Halapricum salinum]|uniref:Uncharacterized protein n=1 Tax=Halapricum salinum TaxID=1457250 RepID=A0A4D6H9W9_9EURY|nr:hypothetical protein [Halapricum salinum]QCC50763.1 hypothetical protein DV733_05670 [Halapricum salinum]
MPEHALPPSAVPGALSRTRAGLGAALGRRDGLAVLVVTSVGYLLAYLYALGHLAPGLGGWDVFVVADPLSKFFEPALGPLSYRPVARVRLGPLTYLFSFNTVIGLGVAVLVGLNMALTTLVWRQPASCGIGERSTPLVASVPALLSGSACCGPVVFLAFGIQASSTMLTLFEFLLPLSVLLLLGSLVLVGRQFEPNPAG